MSVFRPAAAACAALLVLLCAGCTPAAAPTPDSSEPAVSAPDLSVPDVSAADAAAPEEPAVPVVFTPEPPLPDEAPAEQPVTPPPAPEPPAPKPEPQKITPPDASFSTYDFSAPVPEREAVDLSYFSDAAWVGDSRSEGFYLYGVKRGKNLSTSGLSVFTFKQKKALTMGGKAYTALQALSLKEYKKVYLGFGVNELGYINTEKFYKAYCETIDAVRASQPYAVVYAQTMAPVNEAKVAATGGAKHLNNERVRLYNDLIRKAAQEKNVPLLDIYSALVVDGSLPADASRDGIHINREYCQKQLDYLMRHTVDFDTLYPQPQEVTTHETTDGPAADGSADAAPDRLLPQGGESALPVQPDGSTAGN